MLSIIRRIRQKLRDINPPFFLKDNVRFRGFKIGEYTYGTPNVLEFDTGTMLSIGKFCSIATGVIINLGGDHRTDWTTSYPFSSIFPGAKQFGSAQRSHGDVVIGNDVWISTDVMILSGVTIGDGAVLAARSLVRRDVPPYAVVAGTPARIVRYRFDDATIASLLRIRWWDWPIEKIISAWPMMLTEHVAAFVDRFDPDADAEGR